MPIVTGGVVAEGGIPGRYLDQVMKVVARFRPRQSEDDYVVDIAFRSWASDADVEFVGARPATVGRTQRRVIIWHGVPRGLASEVAVREWLIGVLPETARLLREWLPTKSKKYPAEQLAGEVDALRLHLEAV